MQEKSNQINIEEEHSEDQASVKSSDPQHPHRMTDSESNKPKIKPKGSRKLT